MFKVLDEDCTPTRGTKYSACVDLYASEDVVIGAGETKLVGLGVCIDDRWLFERDFLLNEVRAEPLSLYFEQTKILDAKVAKFKKRHYLQLMLRSSLGKKGLILPNGVGIIDLDYRDEIKMIIHNPLFYSDHLMHDNDVGGTVIKKEICRDCSYVIKKGDRIAQITLLEHKAYLFGIDTDDERNSGFGSTDKGNDE